MDGRLVTTGQTRYIPRFFISTTVTGVSVRTSEVPPLFVTMLIYIFSALLFTAYRRRYR